MRGKSPREQGALAIVGSRRSNASSCPLLDACALTRVLIGGVVRGLVSAIGVVELVQLVMWTRRGWRQYATRRRRGHPSPHDTPMTHT